MFSQGQQKGTITAAFVIYCRDIQGTCFLKTASVKCCSDTIPLSSCCLSLIGSLLFSLNPSWCIANPQDLSTQLF